MHMEYILRSFLWRWSPRAVEKGSSCLHIEPPWLSSHYTVLWQFLVNKLWFDKHFLSFSVISLVLTWQLHCMKINSSTFGIPMMASATLFDTKTFHLNRKRIAVLNLQKRTKQNLIKCFELIVGVFCTADVVVWYTSIPLPKIIITSNDKWYMTYVYDLTSSHGQWLHIAILAIFGCRYFVGISGLRVIDKYLHATIYRTCGYLFNLGLKFISVGDCNIRAFDL